MSAIQEGEWNACVSASSPTRPSQSRWRRSAFNRTGSDLACPSDSANEATIRDRNEIDSQRSRAHLAGQRC